MKKLGMVFIIALGVLGALLLGGAEMLGYRGFGMNSGMLDGIGATIAPVYLWLVVVAGIALVLLLMARTRKHAIVTTSGSALDISRARYARGEINKEQFDAIRHDLRA